MIELGHTIDGSGEWMVCWIWEFQPLHGCMGWTYYLFFDTEEQANKVWNEYVKPNWSDAESKVKRRISKREHLIR